MIYFKSPLSGWLAGLGILMWLFSSAINALPGTLSQSPLFTSVNTTKPNIFFEVDDSSSMDAEILTQQYWERCVYESVGCSTNTIKGNGYLAINGGSYGYVFNNADNYNYRGDALCTSSLDYQSIQCQQATPNGLSEMDWRVYSSDFNVLYYNPKITYLPWQGAGMSSANFNAVKSNPATVSPVPVNVFATSGFANSVKNLNDNGGFIFEIWTDSHGFTGAMPTAHEYKITNNRTTTANGMVDYWDNHRRYTVTDNGISYQEVSYPSYTSTGWTETVGASVTASSGPTGRSLADEKQNIANWYQYYRRRSFVAKAAIAKVVSENPSYQYGLSVISSGLFLPINDSGLLTSLFNYNWGKDRTNHMNTPLLEGLNSVGQYYSHTNISYGGLGLKADPITSACQQNFAIVFTDGYWDVPSASTITVGNADGDPYSNTFADIAKYYYDTDLSSLPDAVPTSSFDKNSKQHLVTFPIAFGVQGLLTAGGNGWPNPALTETSDWGNPNQNNMKEIPQKTDDLWHAAYNSRGSFLSAKNPEMVSQGLANILANIGGRNGGSAASVAFNTNTLTGTTAVYLAQFKGPDTTANSTQPDWIGDVKSFPLSLTGDVGGANWSAATQLTARSDTSRNIFTYNRETNKGVPFQWVSLSQAQKNDLLTNQDNSIGTSTSDIATAQARLAYVRGNRSNEGTGASNFKKRSQLLGDIVHSDPLFVGKPQGSWPAVAPFTTGCSQTYAAFKITKNTRPKIVYAGANDGMLHGFSASDGAGAGYGDGSEVMAYIPNSLFVSGSATAGLRYLTDVNYGHRYYVDLPSTVGDACIDTSVTTSDGPTKAWHSILLGGEMAGGRGIFALDITDPTTSSFVESNAAKVVLWEFDNTDDADMGYSYSKPVITMMPNGRWAAIFGNGYNSTGKLSTGNAALFILFLDGGLDGVWTKDTDYIKISAPTTTDKIAGNDCLNSGSSCNGLSSPQVIDINRDYMSDRAYAGDVKGNLWAFDLSDTDPKNWKVAYIDNNKNPMPLFVATHHITPPNPTSPPNSNPNTPVQQMLCSGAPCVQPITSKPLVVNNPVLSTPSLNIPATNPNVLIFFGTGQYLVDNDKSSTQVQSFYGVWDHFSPITATAATSTTSTSSTAITAGTTAASTTTATTGTSTSTTGTTTTAATTASTTTLTAPLTPANLVEQTFVTGTIIVNGVDVTKSIRALTQYPVPYKDSDSKVNQGWFINLALATGERVNVDPDLHVVSSSNTQNNDFISFNTWVPVASECSAGGTSFLMYSDMTTGGRTKIPAVDINGDNTVNGNDKVSVNGVLMTVSGVLFNKGLAASSSFLNDYQYTPGTDSGSSIQKNKVAGGPPMKRISWQELRNN